MASCPVNNEAIDALSNSRVTNMVLCRKSKTIKIKYNNIFDVKMKIIRNFKAKNKFDRREVSCLHGIQ